MLRVLLLFGLVAATMAIGGEAATSATQYMGPGAQYFCERDAVNTSPPDVDIACPTGEVIKVTNAFWGRDSAHCAMPGEDSIRDCKAPMSESRIEQHCNGMESCTFEPTVAWFEWDECMGTYKYVFVAFECVNPSPIGNPSNALNTFVDCTGGAFSLSCDDADDEIVVYSAMYGRTSDTLCPGASVTTGNTYNCVSSNSGRMRTLINGRTAYTWPSENFSYGSLFGPDPCSSTTSYLRIVWMCKPTIFPPSTEPCKMMGPGTFVQCERNGLTGYEGDASICCPAGEEIKIIRAFYGRNKPVADQCMYPWKHFNVQDCEAEGSQEKIEAECDSENSCTIPPTNGFFGDPCVNTYKMVYIEFDCIAPITINPAPTYACQRNVFCEGQTFTIGCSDPNDYIHVIRSKYKRSNLNRCYESSLPATGYSCVHDNSAYMDGYVSGRNSITVSGDFDTFFGADPDCDGLAPYLVLKWCCRPRCVYPLPFLNWGYGFWCERNTITVWKPDVKICCPAGKVIKVHHGFYGRYIKDPWMCPYHLVHNNINTCSEITADQKIKNHCNGQNMCSFPPTNQWFGNDPCFNTYKYVFVSFCCVTEIEEPPPPPCYCHVDCDPLMNTFDNQGISLDLSNGDNQCDLVNTLYENTDPTVCRFRVRALFDANHYPSSIWVEMRVPGDVMYSFHLPEVPLTDTFPSFVVINAGAGAIKATSIQVNCKFDFTIEFGNMPRIIICIPRYDANLLACHGGLCGNCDNQFNDYTLKNGTYVGNHGNKFPLLRDSFCNTV